MTEEIIYDTNRRPRLTASLWAARAGLLIGVLCGVAAGIIAALTIAPHFTTSATLIFPSAPTSKLTNILGGGSNGDLPSFPLLEGALMVPQPGTSAGTAGLILQSKKTEYAIIAEKKLAERWRLPREKDVRKRFEKGLQCTTGRNGELYLGFRDEDRTVAYEITLALLSQLEQQTEAMGLNPARQHEAFLAAQARQAEQALETAQRALLAFQTKNGLVDLPTQAKALVDEYAKLQSDVTEAHIEAEMAVRQANLVTAGSDKLIRSCIDPVATPGSATLAPLYQKVTGLESELALLREKLTPDHPDVQDKRQALAEAQRQMKAEIERQLGILKNGSSPVVSAMVVQAAVAQAKVGGLETALAQVRQTVAKIPRQQATFMQLSAELDAATQALTLYREEREKARIIAQSRGKLFEVLDPPLKADEPDPAHKGLTIILLAFLGILVAAIPPYRQWLRLQERYDEFHDAALSVQTGTQKDDAQ